MLPKMKNRSLRTKVNGYKDLILFTNLVAGARSHLKLLFQGAA